jgi:hypothetical protein
LAASGSQRIELRTLLALGSVAVRAEGKRLLGNSRLGFSVGALGGGMKMEAGCGRCGVAQQQIPMGWKTAHDPSRNPPIHSINTRNMPRGRITSCDQWALDAREPSETSARNRTRTATRRLRNQRDRGERPVRSRALRRL